MQWFKNRKTVTKLALGFGTMAVLLAGVGVAGIRGASQLSGLFGELYAKHALGIAHLKSANIEILRIRRALLTAMVETEERAIRRWILDIQKNRETFLKEFAAYQDRIVNQQNREMAADLLKRFHVLSPEQDKILDLKLARKDAEAIAGLAGIRDLAVQIEQDISTLEKSKLDNMQDNYRQVEAAYASTRNAIIGLSLVAVLLAVVIGTVMARLIGRPLAAAAGTLDAVGKGDFTATLEVDSEDEVGRMAKALNQAVGNMRDALGEIRNRATEVAAASEQLASASEELSSGTQEQASSLEETSASLEEMTATVKQNADSARLANQLAAGSRESAEKGGQVVGSAVAAMAEINASSKRIAEIITTIDEIAFQTNLLALNAAVEAARAGEQGRGFAVVASEVRNLAQRSATAAKEIKTLIQDSVRKVESGSELVNRSGQTLAEIVASVKKVTDIVAEIAAASAEQAAGIGQVNTAMGQMDKVTQSNTAQTEELSSTAQALSDQAARMQALVARFKLGHNGNMAAAPHPVVEAARKKPSPAPAGSKPPRARETASRGLAALSAVHASDEHGFEEY